MNKAERELAALELQGEKAVLDEMRAHYQTALERVYAEIDALSERDDLPGIRQRKYQEALAEQIGGILDDLRGGSYATMGQYLAECYEQGFLGTMYSLQRQGVPLAFPIDQAAMAKAVQTTAGDVKLSKRVYSNVDALQKQVIAEITRGFADSSHVTQVAGRIATETSIADGIKRNVRGRTNQALRRSMTIARTEKGRVKSVSSLEAAHKAKAKGADIVKQWDSTLDGRTRPEHMGADGQIRELEDPFLVGGDKGQAPHMFGVAAQDVNCRCAALKRARKALEVEDKYTKWDGVSQCYVNLSDAKNYGEFKERYYEVCASAGYSEVSHIGNPKAKNYRDAVLQRNAAKVNFSAVNSNRYSGLIRDIFGDKAGATAETCIKRMLKKHDGQLYEDLYAISLTTGKSLGSNTSTRIVRRTFATKSMRKKMNAAVKNGEQVATIHNHPGSTGPSLDDVLSLHASGSSLGVIACHDGSFFCYSVVDAERAKRIEESALSFSISRALRNGGLPSNFDYIENEFGVRVEYLR